MKVHIKNFVFVMLVAMVFTSCEEQEIMKYDKDRAAINFTKSKVYYSFLKTGEQTDIYDISFTINGLTAAHDRSAQFEIVADSTTATVADYEIISAIVPTDSVAGILKIKVIRPSTPQFDDRRVYFRTQTNDVFIPGLEAFSDCELIITNTLIHPLHWYPKSWKSKYFLGSYSTAYYAFLIEATGHTAFPYPWKVPGYNNDEEWSYAKGKAFKAIAAKKLREYNLSIAPDVLLHDDGLAAGKPVIIGKYYQN